MLKVDVAFENHFKGELIGPRGKTDIGGDEGTLAPYDLLMGGLASCLYATFLDIARKKRIGFGSANIEVTGEKRDTIPMMFSWVNTKIVIQGPEKEKGLIEAFELATKYCSIYQTIAHVAEMTWEVEFTE